MPRQTTVGQAATAAEVAAVKAIIDADYHADPANVRAVLLLGRVPVPYSGNINPDGHPNHKGAWPADIYYTLVGTTWTDTLALSTNDRNANQPNDGKFDQSTFNPSEVKLALGRVDMSALPAFSANETELLRRYLNREHAFRQKLADPTAYFAHCAIDDNFGEFRGVAFAQNGYRIATLVGPDNVGATGAGKFEYSLDKTYMQWAFGCGPGSFTSSGGNPGCTTEQFAAGEKPAGVFTMMLGSYYGDYDAPNDLMRAVLASNGAGGLTCVWAGFANWYFHHMGMGEPIATSDLLSLSHADSYFPTNRATTFIHRTLLGDPTLRLHILAPPTDVSYRRGTLRWTASEDAAAPRVPGLSRLSCRHLCRPVQPPHQQRGDRRLLARPPSRQTGGVSGARYL